jgi:hypothetical protein
MMNGEVHPKTDQHPLREEGEAQRARHEEGEESSSGGRTGVVG